MTTDPPSGRALSDERLAEIRRQIRHGYHPGSTEVLMSHIDALTAERDAAREALAALRHWCADHQRADGSVVLPWLFVEPLIAAAQPDGPALLAAERDAAREALAASRSREAELRTLLIEGGYCRVCAMHEDDGHEAWCDVAQEALSASRNRETAWRDAVQAFADAQALPCESAEQLDEKSRAIGRSGHALRLLLAAAGPDEVTGEGGADVE